MEHHTARKYSSPTRERQASQTRTNILDATQRLLMDRGYAKTTIEAIAQEAGVAKQTVYAVFQSKRGIVAAPAGPRHAHRTPVRTVRPLP